ncbi:het domain protein [Colletotrichum karsti]|uniref:Het domain protein n=1 Tax=Colletotrichum karsti TaxID=1095194 RepID=A0A9P6LGZ0_9PEZI|nr:het domain protein [Colletotrichum karsti]KAF9872085.1 het domain protein [Colletotrichum karsti]
MELLDYNVVDISDDSVGSADSDAGDGDLAYSPDIYSSLSHPDSIRILHLLPVEEDDAEIRGELVSTRISDCQDARNSYITLSYVWGHRMSPEPININGEQFSVRQNLFDALQNLRHTNQSIRLWADAICIDQVNLKERNHQVQQMRDIYASSTETIIYLGNDDGSNTSLSAWNFLERQSEWSLNDKGDKDYERPSDLEENLTSFRGEISDVENSVLIQPWFLRVWVLQEVVVSKLVSIQCGRRRIPWDDFCNALLSNPRYHDQYGFSLRAKEKVDIVRDMFQARCAYQESHDLHHLRPTWHSRVISYGSRSDDIVEMLTRARQLEASDPRDKVFALLGISTNVDLDDARLSVDYDKPVAQVYADFARYVMETTQSLAILSYSMFMSPFTNIPSWAPDWNRSMMAREMEGERHARMIGKIRKQRVRRNPRWFDEDEPLEVESEEEPEERSSEDLVEPARDSTQAPMQKQEEEASQKSSNKEDGPERDNAYLSVVPDVPFQDFIGPTILSSLEREAEETEARRKAVAMSSMRWPGSPKLRLELIGTCIGRINFLGPSISLRGLDELAFEKLRHQFSDNPAELRRAILRRWRGLLLVRHAGPAWAEGTLVHEDPDFVALTTEGNDWSLFDDDPDLGPDTIESHLFARGRKTAAWSSDQGKLPNSIIDKSSVLEGTRIGTFYNLIKHSPHTRVILPLGACAEDFIVMFRGARVPFVVRRIAPTSTYSPEPRNISEGSEAAQNTENPEVSDFREGMPFERCKLIGECLINNPNHWADFGLGRSHGTIFSLD